MNETDNLKKAVEILKNNENVCVQKYKDNFYIVIAEGETTKITLLAGKGNDDG